MAAIQHDAEIPPSVVCAGDVDGGGIARRLAVLHHHRPGRGRLGVVHQFCLVPAEGEELVQRRHPVEVTVQTIPGRERRGDDSSGEHGVVAESVPGGGDDLVDVGLRVVRFVERAQTRVHGLAEVVVLRRRRVVGVVDDRSGLSLAGRLGLLGLRGGRLGRGCRGGQVDLSFELRSGEEAVSSGERGDAERQQESCQESQQCSSGVHQASSTWLLD